jgi:hypothetical protein
VNYVRKYAVLLSPLLGLAIGLAGGLLAIGCFRLLQQNLSATQERTFLVVFSVGGFVWGAVILANLIARWKASEHHERSGDGDA